MSTSKRTLRALHYFSDHIVADYGERKLFQFCTNCKDGKHIRIFLSHFCPKLNLSLLTPELAIRMERKFFNVLNHGPVKRMVNKEAYAFGEYVAKRCVREQQLQVRRERKAARKEQPLTDTQCSNKDSINLDDKSVSSICTA